MLNVGRGMLSLLQFESLKMIEKCMRYLDLKLLVHMHFLLDSPSLAYFHENSVWICHVHALMVLLVCYLIISGIFYA
jgi:hypothetical protein